MYLLLSTSICFLFQLDFVGFESEPFEYAYEAKDVILYNLGVGASLSQANGVDLLYEGSENFGALTSFGVIPAMGGLSGLITGKVPGLQIDLAKVKLFTCSISNLRQIHNFFSNPNMHPFDWMCQVIPEKS